MKLKVIPSSNPGKYWLTLFKEVGPKRILVMDVQHLKFLEMEGTEALPMARVGLEITEQDVKDITKSLLECFTQEEIQ
jgi:hypothetical protein